VTLEETLAKSGLDRRAFHVLGKLRSAGPPYRQSAGQLASRMRLSSGAMTNRLDRMEAAGLIRRLDDPNDRRGTLVEPTEAGHAIWDQTVGTLAIREAKIAAVLDSADRVALHRLLRSLMLGIPRQRPPHRRRPGGRLVGCGTDNRVSGDAGSIRMTSDRAQPHQKRVSATPSPCALLPAVVFAQVRE